MDRNTRTRRNTSKSRRTNSGKTLQKEWGIFADGKGQTRYHKDGNFYMPLSQWPGALADPSRRTRLSSMGSRICDAEADPIQMDCIVKFHAQTGVVA